jgi:hypothetical protein
MAGTGKIAALPRDLREELCRRLENGKTGAEILPWLNALPEVVAILADRFNAVAISDANLSNWRDSGYFEWQKRGERTQRIRDLADYARKLGEDGADVFAGGAAIAGGTLMELLDDLDPDAQKELLAEKPENLPKFINALARLQGEAAKREVISLNKQKSAREDKRLQLDREKFENATCEQLLKKATSSEIQNIVASSKPKSVKMAQLRFALFGDQGVKDIPKV